MTQFEESSERRTEARTRRQFNESGRRRGGMCRSKVDWTQKSGSPVVFVASATSAFPCCWRVMQEEHEARFFSLAANLRAGDWLGWILDFGCGGSRNCQRTRPVTSVPGPVPAPRAKQRPRPWCSFAKAHLIATPAFMNPPISLVLGPATALLNLGSSGKPGALHGAF